MKPVKRQYKRRMSLPDKLLTVEEAADRLGLNIETIRRYLRDGTLKGIKFGNRGGWRISERDLEIFLQMQKSKQNPE